MYPKILSTLSQWVIDEFLKLGPKKLEELEYPWWIFLINNTDDKILNGFDTIEDLKTYISSEVLELLIEDYDIICIYGDNKFQKHTINLNIEFEN